MRAFVAIVPPEPAHADLDAFVAPRRALDSPWRWTPAHLWHVTLAFMAKVPKSGIDEMVEEVAVVAESCDPIPLRLKGAGMFPHAGDARVMWTDVRPTDPRGLGDLERLALRTRSACSRIGVPTAGGDYRPHLTLARSRRAVDATSWLDAMEAYSGPAWLAQEVTVFVSRANRSGRPHYEAEARLPLGRR